MNEAAPGAQRTGGGLGEGPVPAQGWAISLFETTLGWAADSAQTTGRRVIELVALIDRAGAALDDIAELRRAAQFIANNLAALSKSADGIDRNSAEIAREITGLTTAAQGIDIQAERLTEEIKTVSQIMPTLSRLTEIVDPLDHTVARLGRFVDRLPGKGRRRLEQEAGSGPDMP